MKVLSWGTKFLKEALKLIKLKLGAIEKMPCPKDIKGIRSFLGHAGSLGDLLKTSLKFLGLLQIFYKRMFHLFLMMTV